MVELGGLTTYLPSFSGTSAVTIVIYFVLFILFVVAAAVGTYFLIIYLKFNKKIIILEDVSGSDNLEVVGRDKAKLVKIGDSGIEVLFLKKRKKYIGAYGKRMGKNTYYFAIGPDGYWYNVTLGSLTDGMDAAKVKPTNVNMRYQNEGLQQTIKSRYDQTTFWQKYGGVIAFVGLIAITGIMIYLLFDKWIELSGTVNRAVETALQVQEETRKIIGALDGLKASGGIASAQ